MLSNERVLNLGGLYYIDFKHLNVQRAAARMWVVGKLSVNVEPFHRLNWQITEIGWVLRPNTRARDELPYPLEVKIEWPLIHPIFQWIDLREKFEEDHGLIPPNLGRFVKICRINSGLAGLKYVPCSTTFGYIWHIFADWWFGTCFTCPQKLGIINWLINIFQRGRSTTNQMASWKPSLTKKITLTIIINHILTIY